MLTRRKNVSLYKVKNIDHLSLQVRQKAGIAEQSTSDDFGLKVTDDEAEMERLKLENHSSIKYPVNDVQKEDTYLNSETTLSHFVDYDQRRHKEIGGKTLETLLIQFESSNAIFDVIFKASL